MADKKPQSTTAPTTPAKFLVRPRITEKGQMSSSNDAPIYTFEVTPRANKTQIMAEIKRDYKVTPVKVRTVNLPGKRVFVRGKWGKKSGVKKALVFLKKGDKIDFA